RLDGPARQGDTFGEGRGQVGAVTGPGVRDPVVQLDLARRVERRLLDLEDQRFARDRQQRMHGSKTTGQVDASDVDADAEGAVQLRAGGPQSGTSGAPGRPGGGRWHNVGNGQDQ